MKLVQLLYGLECAGEEQLPILMYSSKSDLSLSTVHDMLNNDRMLEVPIKRFFI